MRKFFSVFVSAAFAGRCSDDESHLWIEEPVFTTAMVRCAIQNNGAADPTAACLRADFALSSDCALCFGQTVQCGRDHCLRHCLLDAFSSDCLSCTAEKGCNQLLADCTGFSVGPPVTARSQHPEPGCSAAESELWVEQQGFTDQLVECAFLNFGNGPRSAECLQHAFALSDGCSECFGNAVECGSNHCMVQCADDVTGEVCLNCISDAGCDVELQSCTGVLTLPLAPATVVALV